MHHMRSDTYNHYNYYAWKLEPTDLICGVDSSHKNEVTGIGIVVKDNNKVHCFHQPVGSVSNNFGELYAINQTKNILKFLKINPENRRTIIFTDSLYNFIPLITTPKKDLKLAYTNLLNETRTYLLKNNILLWKVRSHTKPIQQSWNKIADILAFHGRMNPINSLYTIPNTNSLSHMKYSHFLLTESNVRAFDSLAANFSVAASMEFELQPD